MTPLSVDEVREWGRFTSTSPLYARLIELIADDEQLLGVLNRIEHSPRPNVLLAGVQYLMFRDGGDELARYYPSLTVGHLEPEGVDGPFKDFVLSREPELVEIGRTRYTQTNECRRCMALVPAIWATPVSRFHLIDLGTSAGLNLLLDRFRYRWDDAQWGPPSSVQLNTENRGRPIEPRDLTILTRTGLDLHPVDPTDPDQRMWLEALIWPEHEDRRARLRAALDLAESSPVTLVTGDAVSTLEPTLDGLASGEPAVVMHSFTLNQLSGRGRDEVRRILERSRMLRPVYEVAFEAIDTEDGSAFLGLDDGSGMRQIGLGQPHGDWVEFYARP